jgi:hypothetical protein
VFGDRVVPHPGRVVGCDGGRRDRDRFAVSNTSGTFALASAIPAGVVATPFPANASTSEPNVSVPATSTVAPPTVSLAPTVSTCGLSVLATPTSPGVVSISDAIDWIVSPPAVV